MSTNTKYELYYLHRNEPFITETDIQETLESCKFDKKDISKKWVKTFHSTFNYIQTPCGIRCDSVLEPVVAIVKVQNSEEIPASNELINLQCQSNETMFLRRIQNQFNAEILVKIDIEAYENSLQKIKNIGHFLDLRFQIEPNNELWIAGDWERIRIFQQIIDVNIDCDVKVKISSSKLTEELCIPNHTDLSTQKNLDLGLFMLALSEHKVIDLAFSPELKLQFNVQDGLVKASFTDPSLESKLMRGYKDTTEIFGVVRIDSHFPRKYKLFLKKTIVDVFHPIFAISFADDKHIYLIFDIDKVAKVQEFIDQYTALNKPYPIDLSMFENQQVPVIEKKSEEEENVDNLAVDKETNTNDTEYIVIDEPHIGVFIKADARRFYDNQYSKIDEKAKELDVEVVFDWQYECIDVKSLNDQDKVLEMLTFLEDLHETKSA